MSNTNMSSHPDIVSTLPTGSAIQQIAFASERSPDQVVLLEFPHPIARRAIVVTGSTDPQPVDGSHLAILTVPAMVQETLTEAESEVFSQIRLWVEAASTSGTPPSHVMTFQGTQLCWTPGRLAILAQPHRIEAARNALVEVLFYESELREIERTLADLWPKLEADMPLAFEFNQSSLGLQKQLSHRFQLVLLIRARLARISPHVHAPHLHPPTLASQIGERDRKSVV